MASILELENYVLKEKDRIREMLSDRYNVRERDIVVDVHNVIGSSYDEMDSAFDRGISLGDIYKFKFRVTLCEGNSAPVELALFGIKLFKKTKGSYVCLVYNFGYEPKDALPGCAHYFYDVYDFVTYEKVMRRVGDHLSENIKGLLSPKSDIDDVDVCSEPVDVSDSELTKGLDYTESLMDLLD